MESTGVYWIPPDEFLEEAGFEFYWLMRDFSKLFLERGPDVQDCQWIRDSLIRPSYRLFSPYQMKLFL